MTYSNKDLSEQALKHFLEGAGIKSPYRIEFIQKEASHRQYFRLALDEPFQGNHTIVLCKDHPVPDPSKNDYLVIREHLERSGLPVPGLHFMERSEGLYLLEDGGTRDLSSIVQETYAEGNMHARMDALGRAIELLNQLHSTAPPETVSKRAFDFEKLHWEMEFLYTALEKNFGTELVEILPIEGRKEIAALCQTLADASPFVFTHRDYHGRNLLVKNPDAPSEEIELTLIDFQDARMGLPWYDVSSLLYDPYTPLTRIDRMKLLDYYLEISDFGRINPPGQLFYQQALQRMLKALGTYFHFMHFENLEKFKSNIPATLDNIDEIVEFGDLSDIYLDFTDAIRDRFPA